MSYPSSVSPVRNATPHEPRSNLILLRLCLATFLGYLTIAVPLPVIPLHVRQTLGYGDIVVGIVIGIQFVATLLTRGSAGRVADTLGPRKAMLYGLALCTLAGGAYLISAWMPLTPLPILIAGRLLLGIGESFLITGMLAWGIGTVGPAHAGKVMTWTGMAIYAALACGAPLGLAIGAREGFVGVAAVTIVLPLLGFAFAASVAPVAALGGVRPPLRQVLGRVALPGLALALQGVGFAAIGAFISLYFSARQWSGAGWALTCFGVAFVFMRVAFGNLPDHLGSIRVAILSLSVECAGLLLLFTADAEWLALLGAAITGLGCSLVFPALGVEVVRRVPAQVRATALGGYAAFQDAAYAVTGPIAGVLVAPLGYAYVFAFGAIAAACGVIIALNIKPAAL